MDQSVLERPVFEIEGRAVSWQDVIDAARASGEWAPIEHAAREGLACIRRAEEAGDPVDEGTIEEAANGWRRARDLIAAEEVEGWLEPFGLTVEDWLGWIRASQLRRVWPGEPDTSVTGDAVARAAWTEAAASGELERLATALAERLATHDPERFAQEAVTPGAIKQQLSAHALDWTRIDCRCVTALEEAVAREAAMCVTEDRMDLGEVAARAGLEIEERSYRIDGSEPALNGVLVGARPGDLIGPIGLEDGFALVLVLARVPPSADDPAVRQRAEEEIVRRAVEREVSRRVRWLER